MKNAPATFSKNDNHLFCHLNESDDVIVHNDTFEEHLFHIRAVFVNFQIQI